VSTSTDGRILWWDTRNFSNPVASNPTEQFIIEVDADGTGTTKILGGTRLDYN
jgi:hypothetical protein